MTQEEQLTNRNKTLNSKEFGAWYTKYIPRMASIMAVKVLIRETQYQTLISNSRNNLIK